MTQTQDDRERSAGMSYARTGGFVGALALLCVAISSPAFGITLPYSETFDTDVATTALFESTYPDFSFSGAGSASVVSGVAQIAPSAAGAQFLTISPGPDPVALGESVVISADIGAVASAGGYGVGFQIGGNAIVFHPGFGGSALRVEGANGFGNTNVGFTVADNVLHSLEVVQHASGLFDITLTDGNNPLNTFSISFTNVASVGGNLSFVRSGADNAAGIYDNLTVVELVPIPEPSSVMLMLVASLGMVGFARRRRA